MYRRRSQCCPGYYESGDFCIRTYIIFPFVGRGMMELTIRIACKEEWTNQGVFLLERGDGHDDDLLESERCFQILNALQVEELDLLSVD